MKSQSLHIKTIPNCMGCKQKDKKSTNDCMSMKITNCLTRIFAIALIALINFSKRNLIMQLDVSISILKTVTYVPSMSFDLFLEIMSKSMTHIQALQACNSRISWSDLNSAMISLRQWTRTHQKQKTNIQYSPLSKKLNIKGAVEKPNDKYVSL